MDADPDQDLDADGRQPLRDRRIARLALPRHKARTRTDWQGEPAAIYCRISHARDEDQTGVERQERLCREASERLDLVVDDSLVYVDNNRSAWQRNRKRPGWDALLQALRDNKARHVLIHHPDRLFRQPYDLEELLGIADDRDITLHGQANKRDLSDPDDRFFLRIEVAHACRAGDDTARRVLDNMEERARTGKPHGGKRRYGYANDQVTIIEHEAEIVRDIFTRYLDGATMRDISKDLNARSERTSLGNAWNDYTIRAVLNSRHVAGIKVFRGQEIGDGNWPAIIDRGLWDEVQKRRGTIRSAYAAKSGSAARRFYLLRGLVTCKACGTNMGGSGSRYLCNRLQRQGGETCGRAVQAKTLEQFATDAALNILETLDLSGRPTPHAVLTDEARAAIEADEAELAELKSMWDERELSTAEYRAMRKVVQTRIDEAQRKTIVRPAVEVLSGLVGDDARPNWAKLKDNSEYARMNAVMRYLFNAVIIDAARTRGNRFDFGRVDIEPSQIWFK